VKKTEKNVSALYVATVIGEVPVIIARP